MTDDEREAYEERAGICEFHGELSREGAERVAREAIERRRAARTNDPPRGGNERGAQSVIRRTPPLTPPLSAESYPSSALWAVGFIERIDSL